MPVRYEREREIPLPLLVIRIAEGEPEKKANLFSLYQQLNSSCVNFYTNPRAGFEWFTSVVYKRQAGGVIEAFG